MAASTCCQLGAPRPSRSDATNSLCRSCMHVPSTCDERRRRSKRWGARAFDSHVQASRKSDCPLPMSSKAKTTKSAIFN
eukprot:5982786-Pleurochrysis_carterae.AAC.3